MKVKLYKVVFTMQEKEIDERWVYSCFIHEGKLKP
jgi:hypothetical protein